MKSELSIYFSTKLSPNCNARTEKITKITIHHMAAVTTAMRCAESFYNPARQGSANYCIDDNNIICVIPEEYRSWCSSSRWNDQKAITIEIANSTGAPDWKISDAAYKNLINLCIDLCKRYDIIPNFTGDKNGTFTYHYMFAATECPGPYIKKLTNKIIEDVKNGLNASPASPEPIKPEEPDNNYLVKITCDDLHIRTGPGTKYKVAGHITDKGVYTIVETSGNWGRLKSGVGWICLKYTRRL